MATYLQMLNSLAAPVPNVPFLVPYPTLAHAVIPLFLTIPFWITFYAGIGRTNDYIKARDWRHQDPNVPEEFDFVIGKCL